MLRTKQVLLVLLVALLHWPLPGLAERFRSEAHGFACSFPGSVEKSTVRTRDGLVLMSFMSLAPDNSWGALVMTGFADPREAASLGTWFRDFSVGLRGRGFLTANETFVRVEGRPAVKYSISGDGVNGAGYVVIDEDRFVSINGMASVDKDQSMIEPFLKTLEILER